MARYRGKHRKPSTTGRNIARTAVAGAVAGAPFLAIVPAANAASDSTWDKLAQCESTGNWSANTGNGFSGGLQFTKQTWKGFGGGQYASEAHQASRSQQIAVAEKVLAEQGWGAWPVCSKKTGASGSSEPRDASSSDDSSKSDSGKSSDDSSKSDSSKSSDDSDKSDSSSSSKRTKLSAPASAPAAPKAGNYTVKSGDTLGQIAAAHGISHWKSLLAKNPHLGAGQMIFPGQKLNVG
ncbi:LysM peptidoglycan-binding domain-containing protein [Pseudonocardia phyllosphaerae]|uniref:LysM peptidoglycan-binding domain-containing protein n=1 Tax=Pseudonocardia phyllosphaerae TaxID=3390502 RepID=UPI00397B0B92